MPAPILPEIVRQHAEMAAHLWNIYDRHLLNPDENPDMDEERLARLVERLEAHLDGLRIAGGKGLEIAKRLYDEFPEAGELFVLRMMTAKKPVAVTELDLDQVRRFIKVTLETTAGNP